MPSADSVQVLPGQPAIFARALTTGWVQLPKVDHCLSVFLRPRPGGSVAIYVATFTGADGTNRIELASSDGGITLDIDNPDKLWVRAASGTPTIEVVCILRGR